MHQIIEILYILTALASMCACVPQLKSLIRVKASDELNLNTWVVWTMAQVVTILYVISIGDMLMMVVALAWVSFYATMAILIVRYRIRPVQPEMVEEFQA